MVSHHWAEATRALARILTLNALARADLELPLGGHHLSVDARDLDASVQTALVVGLDDVTLDDLASTDTAVVGTLGRREAVPGPAVGAVVEVEERVLLLQTEPGLLVGVRRHQLGALMAVVVLVGGAIGVPALGEDTVSGPVSEVARLKVISCACRETYRMLGFPRNGSGKTAAGFR